MSRTLPAMQQSMRESMLAAMRQAMGDQFDPERARRMFDNVQARVDPMLRELMSWEQLKPDLVAIYSETFTQEEIDGRGCRSTTRRSAARSSTRCPR